MAEWVIRDLDDEIVARLEATAAVQRQSLEQALRDFLTGAVRPGRAEAAATRRRRGAASRRPGHPSRAELVAEADAICRLFSPHRDMPSAAQLIREDRDNDDADR
ncbi:MAG: hypothetical protein HQL82_11835 [Magnetococcales bacterium]|nr:hypothetical protein [Magnetococcales bacterium]